MYNEFSFIEKKLKFLTYGNPEARNLKDDCAFFSNVSNLVISTDNSIEGVHVPIGTDVQIQARRSVLRALSDIATFGADPFCIFSSISISKEFENVNMDKIAFGFKEALIEYDMFLAGGDTSCYDGPLMFSITVLGNNGKKESGRKGARPGDLLVISGEIGSSYIGLKLLNGEISKNKVKNYEYLVNKFLIPNPRIELGKRISTFASSIIDISDGLLADLKHICDINNVGAKIESKNISVYNEIKNLLEVNTLNDIDLMTGGDDYELLYTIKPEDSHLLDEDSTIIGEITLDNELKIINRENKVIIIDNEFKGYNHF